jgi:hypothetical protein
LKCQTKPPIKRDRLLLSGLHCIIGVLAVHCLVSKPEKGEAGNMYEQYYDATSKILNPHGGRTAKLSITPFYYEEKFWNTMDRITRAYAKLLEYVFQKFPTDRRIQRVLDYPGALEKYIRSLNIYPINMAAARIDIFLTPEGIRMVESNAEIPGGSEESYLLESEFMSIFRPENIEQIQRLEIVYDTLMHHYRVQTETKGLPVRNNRLNVCLIQWQHEIDRIQGEYAVLIDYIRKKGHRCNVIDPHRLTIEDNKVKTPDGEAIDLIYRRFTGDELPKYAETGWQMAIDLDRADVAVVNPFCTKRVDSKNIMVLFRDTQYEDVFPEDLKDELETVRQIIPWTKKIEESIIVEGEEMDTREYLVANRADLVIKHANSYSSMDVFLGVDIEERRWEQVVEEALAGDWIVQELINLPEMEIEYWEEGEKHKAICIYNVNPYIYDGKLGGFYVRASTDKLTSFKVGEIATVLPCFRRLES